MIQTFRYFLFAITLSYFATTHAADGPTPVRTFGPTGLEIELQKNNTIKVIKVQAGSPAEGKFSEGQVITAINGKSVPEGFWEHRQFLGEQITSAEAADGKITFNTQKGEVNFPEGFRAGYQLRGFDTGNARFPLSPDERLQMDDIRSRIACVLAECGFSEAASKCKSMPTLDAVDRVNVEAIVREVMRKL